MVGAGGVEYATVGALSYRQVLGDNSVMWYTPPPAAEGSARAAAAAGPHTVQAAAASGVGGNAAGSTAAAAAAAGGGAPHADEALLGEARATTFMFVKGLGSSGDTGTIDDNYPAALFYLWRNPELLNALLQVKSNTAETQKTPRRHVFFSRVRSYVRVCYLTRDYSLPRQARVKYAARRTLQVTANCIIIDHFSAFESGLVAPFLYAAG
jgi:hypothetical protein